MTALPIPGPMRRRLGPWALQFYHRPLSYARWLRARGLRHVWSNVRGEAAMRRAAARLAPVARPAEPAALAATFLTGARYWHQTLFCAHSLSRHLGGSFAPTFVDDGTLDDGHASLLRRVFPGSTARPRAWLAETLEQRLPRTRYPWLHTVRDRVPMFRKLVDVRATTAGWQLLLDSDMLCFGRPVFLETCAARGLACHMQDAVHGYCLPDAELVRLAGTNVPGNVNGGMLGFDNDRIDWDRLEAILAGLPDAIRFDRLLEQTLSAVLLGILGGEPAPADDYRVVESPWPETYPPAVILHYIRNAKWNYVTREWRRGAASGHE